MADKLVTLSVELREATHKELLRQATKKGLSEPMLARQLIEQGLTSSFL